MRTASIIGLRISARLLGLMCETNPRLMENKHWQAAARGVAGLIKDIESLNGFAEVVINVDFSAEFQESEMPATEDPRQLRFGGVA